MSFSIRLNAEEEKLFKSYASFHGCSLGEALKIALLEKIEDEYDIALAEQAHNEFMKDPKTYSLEEVKKELGNMSYKVEFSKAALKQLKKMDNYTRLMLINWVEKNLEGCENPYAHGKELKGNLKGQWRYRVGDYRIISEIYDNRLIIQIIGVGHRKEIYK